MGGVSEVRLLPFSSTFISESAATGDAPIKVKVTTRAGMTKRLMILRLSLDLICNLIGNLPFINTAIVNINIHHKVVISCLGTDFSGWLL